jgi:short-subunit dehydrogenase
MKERSMANPQLAPTRKVALVTGASRGIGAETARELARQGYALLLAARSAAPLEALAAELRATGAEALAIPADLAQPEENLRLARAALGWHGRVDVLVGNAGVGGSGGVVAETDVGRMQETIAINLTGQIVLAHALVPQMIERRSGALIFVGSFISRVAIPGNADYSASKFGLRGFAHALRGELRSKGIGVTLVAPGFIDTAMTHGLDGVPKATPQQVALAIVGAIARPKRDLVVPGYYRALWWLDSVAPWITDVALARWR